MSNSSQIIHPTGPVPWEELLVLSTSFTLKSEGETSIFCILTVESFCQYMGCSYEFDWVISFYSEIRNFISHISPLLSLLHTLLKDKHMCLQDK